MPHRRPGPGTEHAVAKLRALRLKDLSLQVRLGCEAEERSRPQEIRISAEFRFREAPKGLVTDEIEDTICYGQVSDALRGICEAKEFKLIERIAYECYAALKEIAGAQADVGLLIQKVNPPVESLQGGSFYSCGDFWL